MTVDRASWLRVLARLSDDRIDVRTIPCPDCAERQVDVRYVVKDDTRVGYVLVWCNACLHGISVSRVQAPPGVPTRSFDDPSAVAGIPNFVRYE